MGINVQAQSARRHIHEACHILLRHYEHTYVVLGERYPRRAETADPSDRNVGLHRRQQRQQPWEILNPDSKPLGRSCRTRLIQGARNLFNRKVMMAVIDHMMSAQRLGSCMRGAETAVVWDAHLGGYPVCLVGIESKPLPWLGFVQQNGPSSGPRARSSRSPPRRSLAPSMRASN